MATAPDRQLSPLALSIEDAAQVLSRSGAPGATVETLQADVAAGAPQNPDGTVNLVHLGAWLIQEMSRLGD
ncbi:MAG: hypothetical protein WD875_05190 [Pirellulales bacterium]